MREQIGLITIVKPSIALMFFNELPRKYHYEIKLWCNDWNEEKTQYWELPYEVLNAINTVVQILEWGARKH